MGEKILPRQTFEIFQYIRGLKKLFLNISLLIRGHSTTTWTEFCHFLTPSPPHLVHVVIQWPHQHLVKCVMAVLLIRSGLRLRLLSKYSLEVLKITRTNLQIFRSAVEEYFDNSLNFKTFLLGKRSLDDT